MPRRFIRIIEIVERRGRGNCGILENSCFSCSEWGVIVLVGIRSCRFSICIPVGKEVMDITAWVFIWQATSSIWLDRPFDRDQGKQDAKTI